MLHQTFSYNIYTLNEFLDIEDGALAIAKIQSTAYFVCINPSLNKMYVFINYDTIETSGTQNLGAIISSYPILDTTDPQDAIPLTLTVDDCGSKIFVLIYSESKSYIKVYGLLNNDITGCIGYIYVPEDEGIVNLDTSNNVLSNTSIENKIGKICKPDNALNGSGMVYIDGKLYVLSLRHITVKLIYKYGENLACYSKRRPIVDKIVSNVPKPIKYIGTDKFTDDKLKIYESCDDNDTISHVSHQKYFLYELRVESFRQSVLCILDATTSEIYGIHKLYKAKVDDGNNYLFLHGLTYCIENLYSCLRLDTYNVPSDTDKWHIEKAIYSNTLNNNYIEADNIIGSLKPEYTGVLINQPMTAMVMSTNKPDSNTVTKGNLQKYPAFIDFKYNEFKDLTYEEALIAQRNKILNNFGYMFKDTSNLVRDNYRKYLKLFNSYEYRINLDSCITDTRGKPSIISIPLNQFTGTKSNPSYVDGLTYTNFYEVFPYDIAIPYSLTIDRLNRKMYCLMGLSVWVFDLLGYTILINYNSIQYKGDIIDFGTVRNIMTTDLTCYFRNDETFTMYDVTLTLEYVDENSSIYWENTFLLTSASVTGYKSINLGDILSGGSKQFIARIYLLNTRVNNNYKTQRLPIRVTYKRNNL